ncbi:MAG: MBL fold metallo-hydrolase [Euryarchaeota archaeon]|nr:MBL fold metallo-hydrolase [Euryarchaeota archaeon]NDB93498.1 MBL fold metallo-hydrolase [Euryarchaeota archaeon]NDF36661.1 MBL fold metallo-hydrolase [Euryarchaeota archaeon]NDG21510.1 MBL fold metallo-hydrolase [Euryarchaeota archaeon]
MLGDGEFDKTLLEDGIEVWVTLMGPYLNMNTAFIDRNAGLVAIVDPYDASRWEEGLREEGLKPTHLLYTHTHRDHVAGYSEMCIMFPDLEVWGHEDARVPHLLGHPVFGRVDFTNTWIQPPLEEVNWRAGGINLTVTHTPGHAPGHVTLHGHGVFHAGDLLFTNGMGRVDLPGSDPESQFKSIRRGRQTLEKLPGSWRMIPGHRYDWIDGTTPDWVSVKEALEHNYALNSTDGM